MPFCFVVRFLSGHLASLFLLDCLVLSGHLGSLFLLDCLFCGGQLGNEGASWVVKVTPDLNARLLTGHWSLLLSVQVVSIDITKLTASLVSHECTSHFDVRPLLKMLGFPFGLCAD